MNILEVNDLCKTYIVNKRQNNVLKNVNFSIHAGTSRYTEARQEITKPKF